MPRIETALSIGKTDGDDLLVTAETCDDERDGASSTEYRRLIGVPIQTTVVARQRPFATAVTAVNSG